MIVAVEKTNINSEGVKWVCVHMMLDRSFIFHNLSSLRDCC